MSSVALMWSGFGALALAAVGSLLLDLVGRPSAGKWLAAGLLAVGGAVSVVAAWSSPVDRVYETFLVGGAYSAVVGVALLSAASALAASRLRTGVGIHAALVVLAVGGATVASASMDLTTMLIGLEVAALSGYALVSLARSRRSDEAAMKYFVQGSVATGLFVLGTAVLIGVFSPDASFASIAAGIGARVELSLSASLGVVAIMAAVAFKAGAAPFHSWAPDAYENATPASSAVLAGAVKLGMITALVSFVTVISTAGLSDSRPQGVLLLDVFALVGALAVVSVAVGSTVALTTRSYTRMLGYAGVAQVGYALIALASLNPAAALFFSATYVVGTTAAFLGAEAFKRLDPDWDGSIEGLAGFGRRAPLLGASVTVALMSLAGIPPLLGFWGKFQAFAAAIVASNRFASAGDDAFAVWTATLAVVGVVGSIVSLGYYGAVVRSLFFGAAPATGEGREMTPKSAEASGAGGSGVVVVVLALIIIVLGVLPAVFGLPTAIAGFLLS